MSMAGGDERMMVVIGKKMNNFKRRALFHFNNFSSLTIETSITTITNAF